MEVRIFTEQCASTNHITTWIDFNMDSSMSNQPIWANQRFVVSNKTISTIPLKRAPFHNEVTVIHPSVKRYFLKHISSDSRLESGDFDDHKECTHHQVANPFWIYPLDASEKNFQPDSP